MNVIGCNMNWYGATNTRNQLYKVTLKTRLHYQQTKPLRFRDKACRVIVSGWHCCHTAQKQKQEPPQRHVAQQRKHLTCTRFKNLQGAPLLQKDLSNQRCYRMIFCYLLLNDFASHSNAFWSQHVSPPQLTTSAFENQTSQFLQAWPHWCDCCRSTPHHSLQCRPSAHREMHGNVQN